MRYKVLFILVRVLLYFMGFWIFVSWFLVLVCVCCNFLREWIGVMVSRFIWLLVLW